MLLLLLLFYRPTADRRPPTADRRPQTTDRQTLSEPTNTRKSTGTGTSTSTSTTANPSHDVVLLPPSLRLLLHRHPLLAGTPSTHARTHACMHARESTLVSPPSACMCTHAHLHIHMLQQVISTYLPISIYGRSSRPTHAHLHTWLDRSSPPTYGRSSTYISIYGR